MVYLLLMHENWIKVQKSDCKKDVLIDTQQEWRITIVMMA